MSSIRGTSFPPFWRREKPVEDAGPRPADVESIETAHPADVESIETAHPTDVESIATAHPPDVESIATAHPWGSAPFLLDKPAGDQGLGRVDGANVFELDLLALLVVLLIDVHLPEVVLRPEDVAGGQHGG